jgi:hypothetical protein
MARREFRNNLTWEEILWKTATQNRKIATSGTSKCLRAPRPRTAAGSSAKTPSARTHFRNRRHRFLSASIVAGDPTASPCLQKQMIMNRTPLRRPWMASGRASRLRVLLPQRRLPMMPFGGPHALTWMHSGGRSRERSRLRQVHRSSGLAGARTRALRPSRSSQSRGALASACAQG